MNDLVGARRVAARDRTRKYRERRGPERLVRMVVTQICPMCEVQKTSKWWRKWGLCIPCDRKLKETPEKKSRERKWRSNYNVTVRREPERRAIEAARRNPRQRIKSKTPRGKYNAFTRAVRLEQNTCDVSFFEYAMLISLGCVGCRESLLNVGGHSMGRRRHTGGHTKDNVVPMCWACNNKQGLLDLPDFLLMLSPLQAKYGTRGFWQHLPYPRKPKKSCG